MRTIIFNDEISKKTVKHLISEIEGKDGLVKQQNVDNEKKTEHKKIQIKIYFTTAGGSISEAKILIDYINKLPKNYEIELIASAEISSSGFDIFFRTKCKKRIIKDTVSVLHLAQTWFRSNEMLNKRSADVFIHKELKKANERDLKFYLAIGIKPEEIKRMKTGKDIYLNYKRLKKILTKAQQLN